MEEAPPPLKESGDTAKGTPMGYLSAGNLQRLTTPHVTSTSAVTSRNTGAECHQGTAAQSGSLSETKMHSILSYLDEMEQADEDMLSQLARSRSEARTRGLPTPGGGATGGIPLWQQEDEQKYVCCDKWCISTVAIQVFPGACRLREWLQSGKSLMRAIE